MDCGVSEGPVDRERLVSFAIDTACAIFTRIREGSRAR